jgi:antitoxin component YwqK of YwqJK toxin-antitoxin module
MRTQKLCLALLWMGIIQNLSAQYYYSDLQGLLQLENKQNLYRALHVREIQGRAVSNSGQVQSNFQENTVVSADADTSRLEQLQEGGTTRTTFIFSKTGQLLEQTEIRPGYISQIRYTRGLNGRIERIENNSSDSLSGFNQREIHRWEYLANGQPRKMWRVLDQNEGMADTTEIQLIYDTTGTVTEEHSFKHGQETGFYYYYYNDQNQITDIVRFNTKFKRLLPDQLFEYDENGSLIQRMLLTGSRDITYLIWRYGYRSDGLIQEEALFNNKKEHTGSIRYSYTFR